MNGDPGYEVRRAQRCVRFNFYALRWSSLRRGPLGPPCEGDRHVTGPAEQPVVLQTAFAAAIGDGNDVVRLPGRARGAPGAATGTIGCRRFRPAPLTMRLDDVEAAQPARALVALLHVLPHVPRAAADLPFVHARIAAERPPRRLHGFAAPTADRESGFIPLGLPPLIGGDDTLAMGTHERRYRHLGRGNLVPFPLQLDASAEQAENACGSQPNRTCRAGVCVAAVRLLFERRPEHRCARGAR